MNPRWEESEFIFCDLQTAARFIQQDNPLAARLFLEAANDAFEFLSQILVHSAGVARKFGAHLPANSNGIWKMDESS